MARFGHCFPVALLGLGLLGAPALAADLLPPPPPPPPLPAPVEVGSGWYLRGDYTASDFRHPKDDSLPTPYQVPPLVGLRLSNTDGYGGGVGYRFNNFLRADVTIDGRTRSRFRDYSSGSNFTQGYNIEAGKLDVVTGLFNVYVDLGTWWGFTPYVGAGVGMANKRFYHSWTDTTCLTTYCGGHEEGKFTIGSQGAVNRADHTAVGLAWAAMAGISYEIGAGVSIDASYRYLEAGKARTGFDAAGEQNTRIKNIAANEFRVGLRWAFGNGFPLPGLGGPAY